MEAIKKQEKFNCPKCGIVEFWIDISIPGFEGKYCQTCYAKWIKKNIPKLILNDAQGKK